MKNKLLLILMLIIGSQTSRAFDLYEEIAGAIRSGDASIIANYFGSTVDLTILDQEEVYSKAQAEQVLRNFFQKNPPKSFQILHKGSSREGLQYAIGSLQSSNGKIFRASFYVKSTGGKNTIQELRFEAD